jgi:hypothetical protein
VSNYQPMEKMLAVLRRIVELYPEALQHRDGATGLFPFQQAAAVAAVPFSTGAVAVHEELPLSISYALLRYDPTLLKRLS